MSALSGMRRPHAADRLIAVVGRRVREAAFWRIQAMVVLISALHLFLEAGPLEIDLLQRLAPSLQHVPVALYVVPVAYAGFIYGFEGGILTGLWCGLLASLNIPLFHRADFEWLAELSFMFVVVGMGVAMSIPVERERRQRRKAEATARQLAMLNEIAQAGLRPWGPQQTADSALTRLVEVLDAEGARLALWRRQGNAVVVMANHAANGAPVGTLEARLGAVVEEGPPSSASDSRVVEVRFATEGLRGVLCICLSPYHQPTLETRDFLVAVGSQLAVTIENALLHQQERDLLESYVQLVTQAQEEERKHIARELHDGAAQDLTVLCRGLDAVVEGTAPESARELARLRRMAEVTLGELRRFGRDLRPTLLDDLGLLPALEWLITDLADRTGIQASLDSSGRMRRLEPEVEVALFRIIQEALRNVERHARASRVDVGVLFQPTEVAASVHDDGRGFEVPGRFATLVHSGRLGLMGIRERAQLLGGSLDLASDPTAGTRVTVRVPI